MGLVPYNSAVGDRGYSVAPVASRFKNADSLVAKDPIEMPQTLLSENRWRQW
jgi:hypothetical protein